MVHQHSFRTLSTIALTASLSMLACKKSNTYTETQTNTQDSQTMTTFMHNHAPQFESFTIDAATGAVLTSSKGTTYTIPANVFQTNAGAAVTGSVTVDIKEINPRRTRQPGPQA
jgi:hypothetical protein